MKICLVRCKHCHIIYEWQASGEYCLDTPKEYNDENYCPECKKAIVDALNNIPIKKSLVWEKVTDISFSEMKRMIDNYEKKLREKDKDSAFPLLRRVFPGCYDTENNVYSVEGQIYVDMKKDNFHTHKIHYRYFYFPGKENEIKITVAMEKDNASNKIIGYWEDKFCGNYSLI
jgi:hypothetical protein